MEQNIIERFPKQRKRKEKTKMTRKNTYMQINEKQYTNTLKHAHKHI